MDAIQLMLVLFLGFGAANSSEGCQALPAEVQNIGKQDFQILNFQCGPKHFKVWHYWCAEGQGYWSRPFLLEEINVSHAGFYLNRFGEIHGSSYVEPLSLRDIYLPKCGV